MIEKIFKVLLIIVTIFIITYGCVLIYEHFTEDNIPEISDEENQKDKEKISNEPIFTLEDYPKVDASLATQPLTDVFIKNFTGEKEISEEYLDYTNTHPGYIRLIDGEVDLIVVTEPSEDELKYAEEHNVELEVIPVVREGFVFYVNAENPVKSLTLEQIQDIYSGKITNWSEVGGNDEEIRAFQRPENSGSQTGMLSLVMKDKELMEPLKEDLIETMSAIINLVSDYDNGVNSIGYSYYYYATTMFETIDEKYPLETAYYIVIRKDESKDSNTRKLVDAMLSDRGQAIAEEAGYVGVK